MAALSIILERLPIEVVQRIFEWVKNTSALSEFVSYLLACKTWKQICKPLMWKNVLVINSNLENFLIAAETNVHGVHFVKNLTIALKMPFPFYCQCDEFGGLDYLVRKLGRAFFTT